METPSPAISFVGRHNSGKTTLIEKVIAQLVSHGYNVGSIKHHHFSNFEIDYPGKDSYRHRAAGASETVIASPEKLARVKTLTHEIECSELVASMPGHDIVIVEGYRKSGLPSIEIMRAANDRDERVARVFVEGAKRGFALDTDFTQFLQGLKGKGDPEEDALIEQAFSTQTPLSQVIAQVDPADLEQKMPSGETVAVATDIPAVIEAAAIYGIPAFPLDDVTPLVSFLEEHYVRPHVSVVIQAGGESRRMGQSKARVLFGGRPMICRLIERVSPAADELIITTNEADKLGFVHEMYPELNIKLVADDYNFRGALPGLCTAINAATGPYVAVVACDMVMASANLIAAEAIEMNETDADAVIPVNSHGYEPFHAIYRKETCLPKIKEHIEKGEKRAQIFFDDIHVHEFPHARVLQAEPMGGCFINANTPDDLKRLEDSVFGQHFE